MDFSWSEEQLRLRQEIVEFARAELDDDIIARDRDGTFFREGWRKCAARGIHGLVVPRAYGGQERDLLTAVLALEGLGYGCRDTGLAFAISSQMWSVQPALQYFGSEEQKRTYLPALCEGSRIGAFCISEPDSGSDTYSMTATARRVDGGYLINAHKSYITLAPLADLAIVFASTDPERGRWGISAFIVERTQEGFSTGPVREKMGLRTSPFGDVILEDCFVSEDARLGNEGAGLSIFAKTMEFERGYIFASQLGTLERRLEEAIDYVRKRRQFGQPIAKFQSVSNRIAEMKLRLETSRLLLYRVAWLAQTGQPVTMDAALAKLHFGESFVSSSLDSIRLHGALGYLSEEGIERDLRDGVGGLIYSGTSDIQRTIIARLLGL